MNSEHSQQQDRDNDGYDNIKENRRNLNSPYPSFSRLRRRLFVTTLNELKAITALASTGLSSNPQTGYSIPAAIGMPTTLYARAQNRFWRITHMVPRDNCSTPCFH
jgi:hypothetical protein